MSEENKMTEESKKTIIAFIAGLLVGGLLVFIFVNPSTVNENIDDTNDDETGEVVDMSDGEDEEDNNDDSMSGDVNDASNETPVVTDGSISVSDQDAGSRTTFTNASFPTSAGWVGVREYQNGQLVGLLGVSRWSKSEGLLPTSISLLRPTVAGQTYAIVFYSENGDNVFSLASDAQMGGVMGSFKAE